MPHALEDEVMADTGEDSAIANFLNEHGPGGGYSVYGNQEHAIDQTDKADDAIDYEDISDEGDLPDEELATTQVNEEDEDPGRLDQLVGEYGGAPEVTGTNGYHDAPDVKDLPAGDLFGESDNIQDLFGEHASSPELQRTQPVSYPQPPQQRPGGLALPNKSSLALPTLNANYHAPQPHPTQSSSSPMSPGSSPREDGYSPAASIQEEDDEEDEEDGLVDKDVLMQRKLFSMSRRKMKGEQVDDVLGDTDMDLFYNLFPRFEENQNPNFVELFPPRAVAYKGKAPLKPPKPVIPTKLSLDLMPDQEKMFRTPGLANRGAEEVVNRDGLVYLGQDPGEQDDSEDDLALSTFDENERIGGVTMQDLAMICEDWDIPSPDTASLASHPDDKLNGEWETEEAKRPKKKQKTNYLDIDLSLSLPDPRLPFEEPERATARLAKTVVLDLNDPNLLIDDLVPQRKRKVKFGDVRRDAALKKDSAKRYNISNDEAYDLLKENHQHKVRSTLGSMAVEHSLPAAKLQYPFYRITLDSKTKRAFHRTPLDLKDGRGRQYKFEKLKHIKRKHLRGRDAKDLFAKAEDLSLSDNSSMLLLEYSEEAPIMMSNFGMGNRLINYYRKQNADDNERPKRDIGETHVLLTQDKSPFANFGHVDKGEIVPTIQNGLYRAPVFQHKPKSADFLVGMSSTYAHGNHFYLRNIENLHTVGQQLPLAEVPGEHSRRVTDAAKKRLRALSYRMYSKSIDPVRRGKPLNNENLMPHLPGHDMPQTRSKMREFMKYDRAPGKESAGVWVPQPGQVVPDAETLRSWIKPEDVCLLDSMQVGVQHLADLGFSNSKDADEDKDVEEGANIELKLAPWQTTKSFIHATQGKAMLQLHGEGDPTGVGLGFSFVKTSMKGGFQAQGESAADKMEAKKRRETGGHSYNVAKQQKAYDESIRTIWNKQKESLSAENEVSDVDMDDDMDEPQSAYPTGRAATPRSSYGTPATFARHEDESASQFSRGSAERGKKELSIRRKGFNQFGVRDEVSELVTNPRVMALYRKRKMEKQLKQLSYNDMNPTGEQELDNLKRLQLEKELARITRNADRRVAREKAKGKFAGSPSAAGSPGADPDGAATSSAPDGGTPQKGAGRGRNKDGTARKCANCGQVGHIKTNRKSATPISFTCIFCDCHEYLELLHPDGGGGENETAGGGGEPSAKSAGLGAGAGRKKPASRRVGVGDALRDSYSKFTL